MITLKKSVVKNQLSKERGLPKNGKSVTWVSFWATDNFQHILLNNLLHRRPITLILGNHNVKNSCWQLMTAVDSCSDINIMIYILRLISVPNFIWIRGSGTEILRFKVRIEEYWQTWRQRERHWDRHYYLRLLRGLSQKVMEYIPPSNNEI